MLSIEALKDRDYAVEQMTRRFALQQYRAFIDGFEALEQKGKFGTTEFEELARNATLESLDQGIASNDPVTVLVDRYLRLPNFSHPSVPMGEDRLGDVEAYRFEVAKPTLPLNPRRYDELGTSLGIFNDRLGTQIAAPGFPVLLDRGATLDRALVNYMLDSHLARGYREFMAPTVANERSFFNTLNPTIEVQEANLFRNVRLNESDLPIRLVGYSRSFRIEDKKMTTYTTLHEFGKVEICVAASQTQWEEEYNSALDSVKNMLRGLEIPYKQVLLCTGSMGQGYYLTNDFYMYAPGSDEWWEIASCASNGDFSSRRLNAMYRDYRGQDDYLHTLHMTSVSIPRVLSAILENNQRKDGSIEVPEVLRKYTGGLEVISAVNQLNLNF
ncbi:hypothetical protein HYW43_02015 [Candidatus Daviesbacteria bacterium]|nr:hypothetical protein [Candidatus Daviesbacteria bacterium]